MSRCPPPPPPPGPAPPPSSRPGPAGGGGARGGSSSSGKPERSALLGEIHQGTRLKKAVTNDRSAPIIEGAKNSSGGSTGGGMKTGAMLPQTSTLGTRGSPAGSSTNRLPPQMPGGVKAKTTLPGNSAAPMSKPPSFRSSPAPPTASGTVARNGPSNGHTAPPPKNTPPAPAKSFGNKSMNGSQPPPPPPSSTKATPRPPPGGNTISRTTSAAPPPPPSTRNAPPPTKSVPPPPPSTKAPPAPVRGPPPPPVRR